MLCQNASWCSERNKPNFFTRQRQWGTSSVMFHTLGSKLIDYVFNLNQFQRLPSYSVQARRWVGSSLWHSWFGWPEFWLHFRPYTNKGCFSTANAFLHHQKMICRPFKCTLSTEKVRKCWTPSFNIEIWYVLKFSAFHYLLKTLYSFQFYSQHFSVRCVSCALIVRDMSIYIGTLCSAEN